MTFKDFLKQKKGIDVDRINPIEFMDEYYDEYKRFGLGLKNGCSERDKDSAHTAFSQRF